MTNKEMSIPLTLFPDGSLNGYDQLVPTGKTITNPTHMVTLTLSTGESVNIGTVQTLMRLFDYMGKNQIWHFFPTEDVICVRAGPKQIWMEAGLAQQKLLAGFCPCYERGQLGWMQRGTAAILSTDEALQSVGHLRLLPTAYTGNYDLSVPGGNASPRMIVFDYNYSQAATDAMQILQMSDSIQDASIAVRKAISVAQRIAQGQRVVDQANQAAA